MNALSEGSGRLMKTLTPWSTRYPPPLATVALSELWRDGPAVLRSCFLPPRRVRLRRRPGHQAPHRVRRLRCGRGARVALIGQGEPERSAAYAERYEIPCQVLCDSEYRAYDAYGVLEGQPSQIVSTRRPSSCSTSTRSEPSSSVSAASRDGLPSTRRGTCQASSSSTRPECSGSRFARRAQREPQYLRRYHRDRDVEDSIQLARLGVDPRGTAPRRLVAGRARRPRRHLATGDRAVRTRACAARPLDALPHRRGMRTRAAARDWRARSAALRR